MLTQAILIPVFVLVACTFGLLYTARDGRPGAPDARRDALLVDPFDLLFYVLIAYLIPTRHANLIMVLLAWVYAVFRILQGGFVVLRGNAATWSRHAGVVARVILLVMWVVFAIEILVGI
jgi:hypothetical protein